MGVAYFIVLDKPIPDFDTFVNGKNVAREIPRLNRMARDLDIPTFDDLVSYDPAELQEMAEDFGVENPIEAPPEKWFSAAEGIQWIDSLRQHINQNPDTIKNPSGIIEDLQEYHAVLAKAQEVGARWHLAIDF